MQVWEKLVSHPRLDHVSAGNRIEQSHGNSRWRISNDSINHQDFFVALQQLQCQCRASKSLTDDDEINLLGRFHFAACNLVN